MNFRKMNLWLALGLSASLALAGCSGGGGAAEPETEPNGAAEPAPTANGGDAPAEKTGRVVVPIFDRGNIPADEGTATDNRWTKWIQENAPVNVEFLAIPFTGNYADLYNTFFASGNAPDLVLTNSPVTKNNLYLQNQLLPMGDIIAEHSTTYKSLMEQYPVLGRAGTMADGELYQLGVIRGLKPNHGLYIRTDWLKKLGMEAPKTTEELYAVAKAFSEGDPDGNGADDTYGIGMSYITGLIINSMFGDTEWAVIDGELKQDPERTRARIEFQKRLFDEGIIDKDFLTDNGGQKAQQDWVTGKVGIFGAGVSNYHDYKIYETLMNNVPGAEVTVIPLPASPAGSFSAIVENPAAMTAVVNKDAEDPVAVMKYIDFMNEPETMKTLQYGIEGEHYEIGENGCPKILDQAKYDKEVAWNNDFKFFSSPVFMGKCAVLHSQLNLDNPIEKSYLDNVLLKADDILSPDRPIPAVTHSDHMPQPPQEINLIASNLKQPIVDIWNRAIVSGGSYTVEQAYADATKMWADGGGPQVDEWYKQWYIENKDTAFLTEDIYDFKKLGEQ
jgi:putative aldouronate transport system substrate-binding protein